LAELCAAAWGTFAFTQLHRIFGSNESGAKVCEVLRELKKVTACPHEQTSAAIAVADQDIVGWSYDEPDRRPIEIGTHFCDGNHNR
jgi:hypothetical protein